MVFQLLQHWIRVTPVRACDNAMPQNPSPIINPFMSYGVCAHMNSKSEAKMHPCFKPEWHHRLD